MDIGIEIPRRVIRYADLAAILGRSVRSLYNLSADSLPPRMTLPDGSIGWHPQDVADWLERQRPTAPTTQSPPMKAPRGQPKKGEQIEAARHGITVHELRHRRAQAGGV